MISILSVNWGGYDFQKLLINSVQKHSSETHPLLIFNNNYTKNPQPIDGVKEWFCGKNLGHGYGINFLLQQSQTEYSLILDIDCHVLIAGWEELFLKYKDSILSPVGHPEKPMRVACLFGRTETLKKYDFCCTFGYKGLPSQGFDVGISAYYKMLDDGVKFHWMDTSTGRYGPTRSEEYGIDKIPIIYHYWHGSHCFEKDRQKEFSHDLIMEKDNFIGQIGGLYDLRKEKI